MNKTEFCAEMAERTGSTKKDCLRAYESVFGCLYDFLSEGKEVNIYGLGQFKIENKPEREARNPLNGEFVTVPAHKVIRMKLSKSIKDAVRELPVE